jgi:hypothetical protein
MILFSQSNHMLGEFYARVLMGFWEIVSKILQQQQQQQRMYPNTTVDDGMDLFFEQTQLYLHMEDHAADMLDSHHLFLDTVKANPLLHFKTLFDYTGCRCMKRIFLCGYDYQHQSTETVLTPGRMVGTVNYANSKMLTESQEQAKQHMRQALLERVIGKNPLMQQHIQQHRLAILSSVSNERRESELQDWKIVGLAQRTGRRRWLGLNQLKKKCNQKFNESKIVCITVDIEKEQWSNPVKHVVAHAVLDALIGIHGAQLTEALWMPPHSLVVELLPYLPSEVKFGEWTTWQHRPTPLGVLFTNTDLNHIGYQLGRTSAPYCPDWHDKECWHNESTRWDNRDFIVDFSLLEDLISRFVVMQSTTCDNYKVQAGDDYVLYNINCVDGSAGNQKVPKHYYKSKNQTTE